LILLIIAAAGPIARSTRSSRGLNPRACNACDTFSREIPHRLILYPLLFPPERIRSDGTTRACTNQLSGQSRRGESRKICLVDDVSEGTDHADYSRVSNALTAPGRGERGRKTGNAWPESWQLLHRRIHVRAHACGATRAHSRIATPVDAMMTLIEHARPS
jgi:hypothetical protein